MDALHCALICACVILLAGVAYLHKKWDAWEVAARIRKVRLPEELPNGTFFLGELVGFGGRAAVYKVKCIGINHFYYCLFTQREESLPEGFEVWNGQIKNLPLDEIIKRQEAVGGAT